MKRNKKKISIIDVIEAAIGFIICVFVFFMAINDERVKTVMQSNPTRVAIDFLILVATLITVGRLIKLLIRAVNGK